VSTQKDLAKRNLMQVTKACMTLALIEAKLNKPTPTFGKSFTAYAARAG